MPRTRFSGIDPSSPWRLWGFEALILAAVMAVGFVSLACGSDEEEEDDDSDLEDLCCVLEDGSLQSVIVDEDDLDDDDAALLALCEEEGVEGAVLAADCLKEVCCALDGGFSLQDFEDCFDGGGTVAADDLCDGNAPEPEDDPNPDQTPDPQPTTPGGECTCGEGTLSAVGDECFEDATECSGFHSVFCFRDDAPDGDPTCDFDDPEQDQADFETQVFSDATEFCAFNCCITLTCP